MPRLPQFLIAAMTCLVLAPGMALATTAGSAGSQPVQVTDQGFVVLGPPDDSALVPPQRTKVEVTAGRERARAFLRLQPPASGPITSLPVTLHEATDPASASLRPETANLIACLLVAPFTPGAQPGGKVPDQDCSLAVEGTRDPDGTWHFDLAPFAAAWAAGTANDGVALRTAPTSPADSWRVVYDTTRTRAAAVTAAGSAGTGPLTSPTDRAPAGARSAPAAGLPLGGSPAPAPTGLPIATAPALPQGTAPIAPTAPAAPAPTVAAPEDPPPASAFPASSAGSTGDQPLHLPLVALVLIPAGVAVLIFLTPLQLPLSWLRSTA